MLREGEAFHNRAKWLLKEGKKLTGAWLQTGSPIAAEIFARAGFDCLVADLEHGPGDIMTLIGQLHAMSRYDAVPLARAPWNDAVSIKRILDTGVYGLIVPYVNSREEAERAVRACKYPLEGTRGVAHSPRAGGFGLGDRQYLDNANEQILVAVAVETLEAARNIGGILDTVGLDGIFVGPMDLSASMGFFNNPGAPEVLETIGEIEKAVLASDKFLASMALDGNQAARMYERGYSLVISASDSMSLARLAAHTIKEFRQAYPHR